MENSKDYYMEEKIGNDGIAKTRNPIYQSQDYQPFQISPRNINIGEHFTSDSRYDEALGDVTGAIEEGLTVDDLRARQQSGWEMAGNAIVNNLVIAGTTAVGGIIGLVDGLFESAYEGNVNKIWDNSVNNKMIEWQDAAREALPVYRGVEYQNKSLLGKMGTGIFWADLFQNLGYTEGMLIPGMGVAGLLSRAPSIVARTIPSLVSAIGEASNEAIRGKNDEINNKTKIANKEYNEIAANAKSPFALGVLDSKYQQTLRDIESDANKAGNFIFGSNIALLTLSNTIQFGNLFSRGFGTSKRLKGALKRVGNTYSSDNMALSMAITGGKKVLDAFSEGMEEVSQSAISNTPMNYTNYNTFNESMFNPDKRELVSNLWTAFGKSYSDTLKDKDTAIEFMSGFLIGALGVPTLRRSKFPITLENNIGIELYDTYKQVKESERLADEINSRLQSDKKINSYYNGLVRHLAIQDRMNSALDTEDAYDYKTAESAQFISDIMMFDDAGDIDHLKDIINNSVDMSDEGIATIIKETSKNGEGPFMYNGNPEDTQSVRTILQERIQTLNSKIDNYLKDKQTLEQNYPNMDKETLSNSLFLKQQYRDHSNRYDLLADELYSGINKLLQTINGKEKLVRNSSIDYFDENGNPVFKDSETTASTESPKFSSKAAMLLSLQFNPKTRQFIEEALDSDTPTMPFDEKQELKAKLTDLYKLSENLKNINKALKDITTDMSKSKKDLDNIKDKKVEEDNTRKGASLKDKLAAAADLAEFRSALAEESDDNIRNRVLKELEEKGNVTAKNYKEVNAYNTDVQRAINSLDEDPTVKADALKLLQDQFENSSNLNEIANPNSIYVDNADSLYDDNLTPEENTKKFQEAQYALLRAMNKINNENRFKDRFSKEYRELRAKGNPNPSAPEKDTTGDSGTSTIPPVNTDGLPVVTYEPPVGNVTATQVKDENMETNSRMETPQSLDNRQGGRRPYYRPSIPELHIQASKEGDFRPFNVVAAERDKGVNFDELYYYLRDNGAFTYVNEGNLKTGDELGFMIDPEFNDHTIFIVDKRNNQVVGSLDESDYSIDRYEGLAGLEEKIRNEYSNRVTSESSTKDGVTYTDFTRYRKTASGEIKAISKGAGGITINPSTISKNSLDNIEDYSEIQLVQLREKDGKYAGTVRAKSNDGWTTFEVVFNDNPVDNRASGNKFIATPTTRVSQVMVGRIPYGTEERSLANIPNVSGEGKSPIFGIIKNGVLNTNGKIDDSLIIKPVDMSQKEGRMYLLIPNAAGKYSPAAIRVKHFNKTEFNPEDVEVQGTQVYKNIQESIDALANSLSGDDLNNAVKSLATNLYTGDLHIDWFSSDAGNGIRFTKVQRDAQGNEIYEERGGKRIRKEEVYTVFISSGVASDPNYIGSLGVEEGDPLLETKDVDTIRKNITNILLGMNLPIQVNLGMLNRGGYNNMLVNSNVLTSNISDARVISSWFTTDYFDVEGNLHQAVNPASVTPDTTRKVETPVGGTEGVITGTKVVVDGATYGVDLTTGVIYGSNNQRVYPKNAQLISDLAWASANFGDATNGSLIWNNKILLPSGQVLDRGTKKYLTGKEAQEVKDKIAGRERTVADSKKVIAQIAENQRKVDKTRTDSEFYYILEEDGQYHKYERVHSRLGSNWVESKKQTEALKDIRVRLSQLADNVTQYNNYLKYLNNYWKVNLDAFSGKIDAKSRDTIVNIIRDSMSGTNSQRALNAGTAVDSVIRNFFTSNDTPVKPDNMSEKAFTDLIASLTEIRSNIEARGERFLTNNIVLFQKYADGTRVAGEVDILSVDANGNFRIYDVKTSRYSFYDFTDKYGNRVNYFINPSATQRMSAKDYYTLQLSAYKNLFESQYHTPITTLAILPFVLNYNKDVVDGVTREKGIMITYNPAVNVPLVGAVKASEPAPTNSIVPVFNSALETQDPVNNVLPEYSLEDSKVGYFVRDGKLHKSYLTPIGKVNGVDVYMAKIPTITRGFGRQGEEAHVASNSYMAVFPNGNSITLIKNDPMTLTEQQAKDTIKKMLNGNPQRVVDMSNEKTIIFDPASAPKVEAPKVETPATIFSSSAESGAAKAAQAEQAVNSNDSEFEDDLDLSNLRRVDDEAKGTWNQEKELAWIKKVLPQLSDNDRVRVVKGLIRVANSGAYAWGQFNNGIITLSDVAAEGTAYHEAFHAVFNLLLDQNERISLLNEYREKHPDMDNLSLEEELAEDFREFVMQGGKDTRSLGRKIIDFFKSLFIKTKYWKDFRPSSIYYFRAINEGKYSGENIPITTVGDSRYKQEEYTQEMKDILTKAPRDSQGRLLAPNGKPSNLTERQYAQVRTKAFKEWFGDWIGNTSTDINSKDAVDYLYDVNPELSKIGSKEEYTQYINSIYPNSLINSIYWHGTDSDLSQGIANSKKGKGSGAPETGAEMYFNKQPWASLQYISGVNRNIPDNEGYNNWVKLWWELKEALGNGRMESNDWKNEIIGPNIRQYSPNKKGVFDRDKGGTHGKYLSERKARYGYQDKTDKEFFEEVFDIRYGKETFNDWVNRKKSEFQNAWKSRQVKKGMYPAVFNIQNPIVEKNQNTYYEEQRGLFTKARQNKNDAIVSNEANNEFGSDVIVVFNPKENVHLLGTKQDIEDFKNWKSLNKAKTSVSKVVDENGEPLVVYHGSKNGNFSIFDYNYLRKADSGFFFTSDKEYAKQFGNIREFFLNIKNPNLTNTPLNIDNVETLLTTDYKSGTDGIQGHDDTNTNENLYKSRGQEYVAFRPNQIKSATDNIGTFDSNNPDIRYRKVPSIKELRAQEKSAYDRFNNDIEEYYREARDIIKEVNYRRFNTEREAMRAFNESGIRKDFFYKITREGANNAAGYKIQLLTRDMIEQYKQDNNPYSDEYEDYATPVENFYFDSLDPEVQMMLFDKGWTKEQFDSISQQERDQAVKCIAL